MAAPAGRLELELAYQKERIRRIGEVTATPDYVFERYRRPTFWRLFADTSPDERQFGPKDIQYICGVFPNSQIESFDMLGRLARLLPNVNKIDKGHWLTKGALICLLGLDQLLLSCAPALSRYCGTVVIVGMK